MQRSSSPRSVTLAISIVALTIVAAACTPSGGEPPASSTTTSSIATTTTTSTPEPTSTTLPAPRRHVGGEAIVADDQEPPTLNVFAPGGGWFVVSIIGQAYWAGVSEVDGNTLEFIPELVTELPTVSNGLVTVNDDRTMTVRYEIRDEAMWEDGTPITGDDFAFTYEIIMNPDLPIAKTTYENIIPESIVVSDKAFEYTLEAPTLQYELLFDTILPHHDIDPTTFMEDWNDQMWLSAGPFVFDSWDLGESLTVVRNENYWKKDEVTGQQLPYLDSVTWRFIRETQETIDAFKAREVDVMNIPRNTEAIEAVLALEPDGARVDVLPGPEWEHLTFQFGPNRLERNENSCNDSYNMRKAIAHAIDRERLTEEILSGQVEPLDSFVEAYSPSLSGDAWAQYTHDPKLAQQAYADAVAETGRDCTVVFTPTSDNDARIEMANLFEEMFAKAGIPYETELQDTIVFYEEWLHAGTWDLGEWAWLGSPGLTGLVSIMDVFDPEGPPPVGQNFYRWGTEELTNEDYQGNNAVYSGSNESSVRDEASARFAELRDAMNSTVDDAELRLLIAEAEAILADNLIILPLYSRRSAGAVWADEIGNYKHNPTHAGHTWNIEYWYRADGEDNVAAPE